MAVSEEELDQECDADHGHPEAKQRDFVEIPQRFYRGHNHPVAMDVGELKKLLEELPDYLPLASHGGGYCLIVFNHGKHDSVYMPMHLSFEEPDDWNYDE